MNSEQVALPAGMLLLLVGLVLFFAGIRSLRLTGSCAGLTLAWALADVLGTSISFGLVIAVGGAIAGLVLISLNLATPLLIFRGTLENSVNCEPPR